MKSSTTNCLHYAMNQVRSIVTIDPQAGVPIEESLSFRETGEIKRIDYVRQLSSYMSSDLILTHRSVWWPKVFARITQIVTALRQTTYRTMLIHQTKPKPQWAPTRAANSRYRIVICLFTTWFLFFINCFVVHFVLDEFVKRPIHCTVQFYVSSLQGRLWKYRTG